MLQKSDKLRKTGKTLTISGIAVGATGMALGVTFTTVGIITFIYGDDVNKDKYGLVSSLYGLVRNGYHCGWDSCMEHWAEQKERNKQYAGRWDI